MDRTVSQPRPATPAALRLDAALQAGLYTVVPIFGFSTVGVPGAAVFGS